MCENSSCDTSHKVRIYTCRRNESNDANQKEKLTMNKIIISDDKSGKTVATVTAEKETFVADLEESGWRVLTDYDVEWAPGVDHSDWAGGTLKLDGATIRHDNLSYSA